MPDGLGLRRSVIFFRSSVKMELTEIFSRLPAGGTVFNVITVAAGSALGLSIGRFIPERLHGTIFQCFGLFTMYVGMSMALGTKHAIAVLVSLVIGTLIGDLLNLDRRLNGIGDTMKERLHIANERFTQGFVTATLLFCIGSMSIIGAFNDGMRHDPSLLMTKGVMDGISAVLLAGSFGVGVLFSIIPMFIYQGALTLAAVWAQDLITPDMYANISGIGGLMILAIGLNLLKVTSIRLCDMLPSLIFIIFFTMLF